MAFVYLWHSRCCSVCHLLGRHLQKKTNKIYKYTFFSEIIWQISTTPEPFYSPNYWFSLCSPVLWEVLKIDVYVLSTVTTTADNHYSSRNSQRVKQPIKQQIPVSCLCKEPSGQHFLTRLPQLMNKLIYWIWWMPWMDCSTLTSPQFTLFALRDEKYLEHSLKNWHIHCICASSVHVWIVLLLQVMRTKSVTYPLTTVGSIPS